MKATYKSLSEVITDAIVNGTATKYDPTVIPDGVEPLRFLMNKAKGELLEAKKGISFKTNISTGQTLYDVGNIAYPKVWFGDIGNI